MLKPIAPMERYSRLRQLPNAVTSPKGFDKAVDLAVFANVAPEAPFLSRETPLLAIGSCFAQNIANNLRAGSYDVLQVNVRERLFNPFALEMFIAGIAANANTEAFVEHWEVDPATIAAVRERLTSGATIILTFGLSYVWIDKVTNQMVFDPTRLLKQMRSEHGPDRYWMHPTTVPQNVTAMKNIIASIRGLNPDNKIIITLSPVHLARAVADYPGIMADCVSKSTLRCAIHEITMQQEKDLYYFPSFELLRWFAPMMDVVFFEDNLLAHVRNDWVDYTLSKFKAYYCVGEKAILPPLKHWQSPVPPEPAPAPAVQE